MLLFIPDYANAENSHVESNDVMGMGFESGVILWRFVRLEGSRIEEKDIDDWIQHFQLIFLNQALEYVEEIELNFGRSLPHGTAPQGCTSSFCLCPDYICTLIYTYTHMEIHPPHEENCLYP
jgi:hypothetical protein